MLLGEYTHTLDSKKRLSLPAKFRKEIGKKVIITHGLDRCLFVYSVATWKELSAKLAQLSMGQANTRGFTRFLLAGAVEAEVDNIGRILVPDFLKSYAGLTTRVVIAGVHNRIEVWDEDAWRTYKQGIEKEAEAMAETLGTLGML